MFLRGSICFLFVAFGATRASAQLRTGTPGIGNPSPSLTAPDDAFATTLNPAALPFLRTWSVTGIYNDVGQRTVTRGRGLGLYAAAPLWVLGFGLGAETFEPASRFGERSAGIITLSLAAKLGSLGLGGSLRGFSSRGGHLDGLWTLDLAAYWQATTFFALSFLARDVTGPGYSYTTSAGVANAARNFTLSAGIRLPPFRIGTERFLSLGLDGSAQLDTEGRVGYRFALELGLPWIGRAYVSHEQAEFLSNTRVATTMVGLTVQWSQLAVGGGALITEVPGATAGTESAGAFATARVEGERRAGIPDGDYVLSLELAGLDPKRMLLVAATLERASHASDVRGVYLRVRGSGMNMAYAQEVRMLISELRASGKPVVCHLETASGSEFYACGRATAIYADPLGAIRLTGPELEVITAGDALSNLGVRADFLRIGEFKSGPELYENRTMSGPARLEREEMLHSLLSRLTSDLATDLSCSQSETLEVLNEGPYLTEQAVPSTEETTETPTGCRALLTGAADEQDMSAALYDAFGATYPRRSTLKTSAESQWGSAGRVAVVLVEGDIVEGGNVDIPLLDMHMTGGRTTARLIGQLADDPSVGAIVLRIDSPGGSVIGSDQIWRAVMRAREKKPVIASMGAIAASGGYYIASAAHEIWADPSTLTGSIGVFYGKVDFAELGAKLGVRFDALRGTRRAGFDSLYRPFSADERAELAEKLRLWYRRFLSRIQEGRGMDPSTVDPLARGRVWSGDQARANGLVDHLGGFASALVRARALAGLPATSGVSIVPDRPDTLLDYVVGGVFGSAAATDAAAPAASELESNVGGAGPVVLNGVLDALRAFASVAYGSSNEPLARWESEFRIRE